MLLVIMLFLTLTSTHTHPRLPMTFSVKVEGTSQRERCCQIWIQTWLRVGRLQHPFYPQKPLPCWFTKLGATLAYWFSNLVGVDGGGGGRKGSHVSRPNYVWFRWHFIFCFLNLDSFLTTSLKGSLTFLALVYPTCMPFSSLGIVQG